MTSYLVTLATYSQQSLVKCVSGMDEQLTKTVDDDLNK